MKEQDDKGVPGAEPPVGLSETPLRSGPADPAALVSTIPHAGSELSAPHYKRAFIRKLGAMKLHFYEMHDGKMALDADDAAAFFGMDMLVACQHEERRQTPAVYKVVPPLIHALLEKRGPQSTPAIAEALWTPGMDQDRGTFRNSIRNHVWKMHKKGLLVRELVRGEWLYSNAPSA